MALRRSPATIAITMLVASVAPAQSGKVNIAKAISTRDPTRAQKISLTCTSSRIKVGWVGQPEHNRVSLYVSVSLAFALGGHCHDDCLGR